MEGFVPDEVQPEELSGFTPDTDVPFVEDVKQPEELQEPMFAEGTLGANIGAALKGRLENTEQAAKRMAEDEQTYLETAAQGFGQVLMAGNDVVSETILGVLSGMTPDAAETWLKEQIDTGADALMDTNTAKYLYEAYSNLSDRARADIDAAANIGMSLIPMSSKTGKALKAAGERSEKSSLGRYLLDQSAAAKKARNAELGMDPKMQTVHNREDAVLNTALTIKGITASTPRKKMMTALNAEVARLGTGIKKALAGSPLTIPKGTVTRRMSSALAEFKKANPEYSGQDLKHIGEKVKRAYLAANKSYTGRPEDLLEVRRKFDKVIERFFGKDVHAGDHTSRPVVAALRNELNAIMQEAAPDAKIRSAMQRQHHAMTAKDNLAFNMVMEKSGTDKVLAKIEHHPYFVTGALTGTGMGAQLMQGGAASEVLGLGAGMLGVGYGVTRPPVLKGAGEVLETTKPAKSLLVDMLNQQAQRQEEIQE
jgi:hypothetical protein